MTDHPPVPSRSASEEGVDHPTVRALRAAIAAPTIARDAGTDADTSADLLAVEAAAFDRLHAALAEHFPLLHGTLDLIRPAGHALLFRWRGRTDADPVVLMAHQDVVPIGDASTWTYPPFAGVVADSPEGPAIWGRGSLDDKGCLVAICAAVERLLGDGFVPTRDIWLSFGSDEEVMGITAEAAVDHLRDAGIRPWFVLDEGGAVAADALPGITAPMAVIGVSEKGLALLELRAEGRGGHASTPARNGPVVRVATAIAALDRASMPVRLPEPSRELLRRMIPVLSGPMRRAVSMVDGPLAPVFTRVLGMAGPEASAMARTSLATTMISGSPAPNAIAASASAIVNARIVVGDTIAGVVRHVRRVVGSGVEVRVIGGSEPSPVSPYRDDPAFDLLEKLTTTVFPEATPSPYLMLGATDSRHFTRICNRVYRFAPFPMSRAQRESVHSFDERLTVDGLLRGVEWYVTLLRGIPE